MEYAIGLLFLAIGVWSICGPGLALGVFMDHPKARTTTEILGRTGARVFFVALGAGGTALGVVVMLGA